MGLMITQRLCNEAGEDSGGASGTPEISYKYPEGLDAEYHGNATLLKHAKEDGSFNVPNIMKSLVHATSVLGKEKISIPDAHFTPDQWKETFHKLGLPKTMEEYKILNNQVVEGIEADEKMFNTFKQVAYESGLLPRQAQAIVDFFNKEVGETITTNTTQTEKAKADGLAALNLEWGKDAERNVKLAKEALSRFAEGEELESLQKTLLETPQGLKLFSKIGKGLLEDNFTAEAKGNLGASMETLKAERDALYKDPAFTDKFHPLNNAKKKRFMEINTAIAGEGDIPAY